MKRTNPVVLAALVMAVVTTSVTSGRYLQAAPQIKETPQVKEVASKTESSKSRVSKLRASKAQVSDSVRHAIEYLRQAQGSDGSYSKSSGPGVTCLITAGLLRSGKSPSDPLVAKSLQYILRHVQKDGGVYSRGSRLRNYETCLAMLCLVEANKNGKYDKILAGGEKFIKGLQWDESESHDFSSDNYGGAGYGKHKRPDLSNTNYLIDALKAAGKGPEDPAMKKALVFVSRCQNLDTEHNQTKYASKINDGGFYYTIAAGGNSKSGDTAEGGLRSYGSMTYAGLKSMIYAGVTEKDPRVQGAYKWIQQHYDLDQNPGMGPSGLFYYYHTFAKALDALGHETLVTPDGVTHLWRQELAAKIISLQQENGSWINQKHDRWMEGDPNLVTGYVLLTLSYCAEK